ncbi:MAG: helix-turn-helix domain-containing protein, partial [Muribaculaceae bacterium]|nr:helix-turn-helix domain-containing protein [Muribaculaceae bacterium]
SNGKDGIRLASKYTPDLIICDVMMPVMDGLECCRRLKTEVSTSHIPVLMLTACSMDEQRARGYDNGADGYLSKPFNAGVLKARCNSLIENRKRIINSPADPSSKAAVPAPTAGDIDNEFYRRFADIINERMADPDLSIDSLAAEMGLGRSQLYRKIKSLTNYTPVEVLRNLRLKRSRDLLVKTQKSISEVGYEVGFSTPAYFTRCFKEAYGETPSELRDRLNL